MKRAPSILEKGLQVRVSLLATTLRPATVRQYAHTVRLFGSFLREEFSAVRRASQLRRDPHVLGWLEYLWKREGRATHRRLCASSRAAHLIRLRKLLELLADDPHPPLPGLLLSQDIPRPDQLLPRPLGTDDDVRLLVELRRRNDLWSNALLLTRLTGLRIGETADLAVDCLRHLGSDQWSLHVPLGKLHSERWTPVDEEVRQVVARLLFLRTLPPTGSAEFLLPRPKGRSELCVQLRAALSAAALAAGISTHMVPHQLRHYAASRTMPRGSE